LLKTALSSLPHQIIAAASELIESISNDQYFSTTMISQNSSNFKLTSLNCIMTETFNYLNITDLPDSVEPTWSFLAVLNAIASPVTIIINFLIIWTIVSDKELRKVSHNILLTALAMSDLMVGLIIEPMFSWYLIAFLKRRSIPCHFLVYIIPTLIIACWTLNTLAFTSIDIYLAVEHSQFYLQYVTTRKIMIGYSIFVLINVPFLIVGTILLNYQAHLKKISASIVVTINILIILYCTIKVQITAYRQRRAIQDQVQAVQPDPNTEEDIRRIHYKQAVAVGLVVLATFLFYCPLIVFTAIQSTQRKYVTDDFQFISFATELTFIHLQSLVNPIVIYFRLSYIREGIKDKLLCRT